MRFSPVASRLLLVAALAAPGALAALSRAAGAQDPPGPAVGERAPDFSLPGATRQGVRRQPISLSAYRGQTVVLAFFYKARTKG